MYMHIRCLLCLLCLSVVTAQEESDAASADTSQPNVTTAQNKSSERLVVSHIPELPASIAKPGRLDSGTWLILFYTPWCEHSTTALPHFKAAVQEIVDRNLTGVSIGKLDVSKESGLGKAFHIRSTPTIAMYRNSLRYNFDEEITTANLKSFVIKIMTAGALLVNSSDELETYRQEHPVLFLLVHDVQQDSDWQDTYSKLAREMTLKGTFLYTLDPNILKAPPAKLPAVLVLKDGDAHQYSGALSAYALSRWIAVERFAALPVVTMDTLRPYLTSLSNRKLVVLAVHEDSSQRRIAQKKAHEAVKKLAYGRQLLKWYQFLLTEGSDVPELLLRRSVDDYPQLFVFEPHTGYYYRYTSGDKGFTESAISEFLRLVKDSKIEAEGGITFSDVVKHVYGLGYSLVQAIIIYHPFIGGLAVLSLMGVVIFYLVICTQNYRSRKIPRSSRTRARQAALARRDNTTTLRRRHQPDSNHSNNLGEDGSSSGSSSEEEETSKDK